MKVLWFTNTSSLYDKKERSYFGGGWIESLELLVREVPGIELGISFFYNSDIKVSDHNVTYYPILKKSAKEKPFKTILDNWRGKIEPIGSGQNIFKVIDDFKPDIIHVFGTESIFASIQHSTNIPVVIHLQGLINPILNSYFPPGQSKWNFFLNGLHFKNNLLGTGAFFSEKQFISQAKREEDNLKASRFIAGRTYWDNSITKLLAPNAKYFHIDEVLRPCFYSNENKTSNNKFITIISTLSSTTYKGIDVVLKTAQLLKQKTDINFKWKIVGVSGEDKLLKHFESFLKVSYQNLNIECMGTKTPDELLSILIDGDLFIHPSYIDNSPNSVCEAQMTGLLVIACNVGGLPSLIEHNISGVLVPANGIYEIVTTIKNYIEDPEKYNSIAKKGRENALMRHNKPKILSEVINMYNTILNI